MTEPLHKSIHTDGEVHNSPISSLVSSSMATFLLALAMGASTIIIPATLQKNGISITMIGLIMSFDTVASLLISLLFYQILRIVGMRAGLLFSTLLRTPALLALALTSNAYIWALAVFVNGAGYFAFMILLQTRVAGLKFQANKGLMMALFGTSTTLGLAAGPVLLASLQKILPLAAPYLHNLILQSALPLQTGLPELQNGLIFMIITVISLLALVPVLKGSFPVPSLRLSGSTYIWKSIMKAKGPMFAMAMAGVSFFGVCAFITLYGLKNNLKFNESALLLSMFMMGSLLLETPLTWVSDFIDRRYVIVIAAFISMICAVYLPMAIYVSYQACILLFIWGGVIGAIYSTALALIGEKFDGDELVAANAGYSFMEAAGGTAGVLLIGIAMDLFGSDGLSYVIMLSSIC